MHMQLLRNNKVVIYDRTDFGPSNLSLGSGRCRFDPSDTALQYDCTAHSVLYDVVLNAFRPLMLLTDSWCSSGSVLPNGTLVQIGGFNDGDHVIRTFSPCLDEDNCDWIETPNYLARRRWYASNQVLSDGRIIVVGGRRQFNYEFYPKNPENPSLLGLHFLRQTSDLDENNLYPFLQLLPDGNLFIFANTRSISFNYHRNRIIKEFPPIPGGDPRNYPSSGSSVLLPLDENKSNLEAEIMVCGGAPRGAHQMALEGTFVEALISCGRLVVTNYQNPNWVMEDMPMPRAMGDMVILPSGDIIIINGVGRGTAGWELGQDPVMAPVIYYPTADQGHRFTILEPSSRPRLYHSTAILLPNGQVLVGGSNPHVYYNFTGVDYPTELSLDAFSPPYLSVDYEPVRPKIIAVTRVLVYGQFFSVVFSVAECNTTNAVSISLIAPSFTTHSFGMNQRMVVMKLARVVQVARFAYNTSVISPSTAEIAPPGYYMLFVVHAGIPSLGAWVKLM
ncbi:hypothetical protein TIFTF001_037334 [Ficus carica]|uniref:Galactose oxidase n=1 Tax=Ficus carica TaxID=3494 RepID=A0AA88EGV9_FICCA|nr:hypothetical protein TIFTF001_037334 [Ficus carica]